MSLDTDWHQPSRAIEVRWWRLYRYWKMLAEIVLLHHHFHLSLGVLINVMAWRRILSFIILPWIPLLGDYFIVQDFLLLLITISWWSTQVLYCWDWEYIHTHWLTTDTTYIHIIFTHGRNDNQSDFCDFVFLCDFCDISSLCKSGKAFEM